MAVVRFGLAPGFEDSYGKITEGRSRIRWLAVTNSVFDLAPVVAAHGYGNGFLPTPYLSFHPYNTLELCRTITFRQDQRYPTRWEIEAEYSSEPLTVQEQEQEQIENPNLRPPKVHWRTVQYRKPIIKDKDGDAIVNSAGDYFDPPVEIDASYWTCTIQKNVPDVPTWLIDYENAVNDDSFYINGVFVGPRVAKLMEVDVPPVEFEGIYFFIPFSFTLEFRRDTWDLEPIQQGWRYKDGTDRKEILDDSEPPRPITSQKLLDAAGAVLANPTPANAVYGNFRGYEERDFTVLPGITEITT